MNESTIVRSFTASTPSITNLSGSEFLHKLSVSILNSVTGAAIVNGTDTPKQTTLLSMATTAAAALTSTTHVAVDSADFGAMDDLQKQLRYDKLMNEVWIGIVFTLILVSLVFCICSCFLYHQFRTWQRNFRAEADAPRTGDVESSLKLNIDFMEDPVPEYTLVSGLPTYEAALELLHKKRNACIFVYPTVFSVFNRQENASSAAATNAVVAAISQPQTTPQQQPPPPVYEALRPLVVNMKRSVESNSNNKGNNGSRSRINDDISNNATTTTPTPTINTQSINTLALVEKCLKSSPCDLPTSKDDISLTIEATANDSAGTNATQPPTATENPLSAAAPENVNKPVLENAPNGEEAAALLVANDVVR